MKTAPSYLLTLLLTIAALSPAFAETGYISDTLVVTLRSQKGNNYEVLDRLITATAVDILEEDKTYAKVRTAKGVEGYIRKQYLTKELPKALRIEELQTQIEGLRQELEKKSQAPVLEQAADLQGQALITELKQQLEDAEKSYLELDNSYRKLQQDYQQLQQLPDRSDSQLSEENRRLTEQNKLMDSELLVLREENRNFHRSNMIQWFLAGAGVFFVGWLIGKVSRRKTRGFSRI